MKERVDSVCEICQRILKDRIDENVARRERAVTDLLVLQRAYEIALALTEKL